MRRILIGYMLDGRTGGIDRYLLNLLEVLLQEQVQVDFLTSQLDEQLREELKEKGCRLFEVASLKHFFRQYQQTRRILREGGYDTAYFNISEAFHCMGILAAAKEKVPRIMVHSHNSGNGDAQWWKRTIKRMIHAVMKQIVMKRKPTDYIACSRKAGEWMYPKAVLHSDAFRVLNNAIQSEKFVYDPELRARKRRELGIEKRIVIGHVGRFCYAKNIGFLVDVIDELRKMKPEILFLSVGSGPDFESIQNKVERLGLQDHVQFLGNRSDVPELLQAMDLFLLPSHFEGLPIVAIEAQVSGLKVVLSNTISEESALSDRCIFCDLHSSAKDWANVILNNLDYKREDADFSQSTYVFSLKEQEKQILNMFGFREESVS